MVRAIFTNSKFTTTRKKLRQEPIKSERLLWGKLRDKQLGFKFRRQHSIGPYVVDFYCPVCKLVIELDGESHFIYGADERDRVRELFLMNQGVIIKRYLNSEIAGNIAWVVGDIVEICEQISRNTGDSSP